MLLPRIFSAVVMAFLFLFAVFFLGAQAFSLSMAAVVVLAAWEWASLSGVKNQSLRVLFALLVAAFCYMTARADWLTMSVMLSPLLWCLALYWVIRYPTPLLWQQTPVRLLFGALVMVSTWAALVVLKQSADFVTWVLLLMGLIWGADSGAYFAGRRFGKRKLAQYVSPGKSWEGVFGGIVLTQIGVAVFSFWQLYTTQDWLLLALVALVTTAVSVLGDLTESLFKRYEGMKDSSHLIPGHGGVMDRVDSLVAAAPIFVVFLMLTGWL
ncbi:phosphatidate cytidylyltransferase [Marinomonas sp. THO17]|uniref:phosphatidate cytidylyltransferase n=1 Tax=Marinomonas sp. THO17 TaxID=3149048 RepID=UPI00336BB3A5